MTSTARRSFLVGSLGAVALGATAVPAEAATGARSSSGAATTLSVSDTDLFTALVRDPELLFFGAVTRDAYGAVTSAPVVWPDGTTGTFTADTASTAFPGAVDAYHVTYGDPVTATYTQPAVTRDARGDITDYPAITVS